MWKKLTIMWDTDKELEYNALKKVKYKLNKGPASKKVVVYSLKGTYLKTYKSVTGAAEKEGVSHASIIYSCRGTRLYCRLTNKIYLYEDRDIKERLSLINKKLRNE